MEQSPATRRLTREPSEDSPVEFVVVESDVSMSDAGLSTPEKKPKKKRSGLSFKKLRSNAQKLIPKRGRKESSAKSSETSSLGGDSGVVSGGTDDLLPATPSPPPPPASPTATETSADTSVLKSTESLPAIKEDPVREAVVPLGGGARSDEEILLEDKQRQKKTRKPSRAASFMKKLAGRSKTSKVAPNPPPESDDLSSGTLETPLSIKRQTPEGATFVSDGEQYDDGTSVDPPSPVLVRQLDAEPTALRAKRTEMKITLTRNSPKPSTMETSLDGEDTDVLQESRSGGGDSDDLAAPRRIASEYRELGLDSKPISSNSIGGDSGDVLAAIGTGQSAQLIAATRTQQSSSSTSSVDARLSSLLSGDYIAEINKFSIENISNAAGGAAGPAGGSVGGGAPGVAPLPQPRVSLSIRERFFQQPVVTVGEGDLLDSQDVAPPSSVVVDEEIDGFMRKARGANAPTGTGGTKGGQNKSPATVEKPPPAQPDLGSPSPSKAGSSTVRTQEAAKPYQLGNSLKNPNNSGFKSIEQQAAKRQEQTEEQQQERQAVTIADQEESREKEGDEQGTSDTTDPSATEPAIVFDIGTQVRPDRTSSILKPAGSRVPTASTLAVPSVGIDSGAQSGTFASLGSIGGSSGVGGGGGGGGSVGGGGSYDDSSQNNTSEGSLRRIAYVEQLTFYTPEEEELLTGKPPRSSSSLLSSALESGEYSLESEDYLEGKMAPHGDLLLEKGATDQAATMATGQAEKREHLYKILVIGELGTGKTSFIKRYVHQFFSQNYRATIGVDFALKVLNWDQNTIIRLQLWDIAGQERFGNMTRVYYKEAVGAFIVFDVTRSATFDAVIKWKNDLDSKVQLPDGKPIPCILLANKSDQQKQGIVTTPAKLDEYVKEHGFAGWFETSAKENVNIEEAAKSLVNKILMNDKLLNTGEVIDSERFALAGGKTDTSQKKSCSC
uniref:Ras-related protein Rab n=1 Tax=Anopheles farauti TaxID=69004 RepID=A0A182R0W5_9DIPT